MRITVGEQSYDLADLPRDILRNLRIDDESLDLSPATIVSESQPFYSRRELRELWKQEVAKKKARWQSTDSTQPLAPAGVQSSPANHQSPLPRFRSAKPTQGTPRQPLYPPDWSIKINFVLYSLDSLNLDQLQLYKNEVYNRYTDAQYRLQLARLSGSEQDTALYQAESDRWSGVFKQIDTAITEAKDAASQVRNFLADIPAGTLYYGKPWDGPAISETGVARDNGTVVTVLRSLRESVGNVALAAMGAQPGPTTPPLPDADGGDGYITHRDTHQRAINPDIYANEAEDSIGEAAPSVFEGLAAGLNEALNGGRVNVEMYYSGGARYIVLYSPGAQTELSVGDARDILGKWLNIPPELLPSPKG